MTVRRPTRARAQLTTVLLVGEGHAEHALLTHLKHLYVTRGDGVAVTIKNARGKGAAHVIDYAIRQTRNAAYDRVLALLDTDVDWGPREQKRARNATITVVACTPCLEALLLDVSGGRHEGLASAQLKRVFQARFGAPADEPQVYSEHFTLHVLEQAKPRNEALAQLLNAMRAPTTRNPRR